MASAQKKPYQLIPKPVPTRQRASIYREIISDFLSTKENSVLVHAPDRKPATLLQGLRKVLVTEGMADEVRAVQRGEEVYLVRVA